MGFGVNYTMPTPEEVTPVWRHLLPTYYVIQLFTKDTGGSGRLDCHGQRMAATLEEVIAKAEKATAKMHNPKNPESGIIAWSLPVPGGWSKGLGYQLIPDVSLPPGWNEFFGVQEADD